MSLKVDIPNLFVNSINRSMRMSLSCTSSEYRKFILLFNSVNKGRIASYLVSYMNRLIELPFMSVYLSIKEIGPQIDPS